MCPWMGSLRKQKEDATYGLDFEMQRMHTGATETWPVYVLLLCFAKGHIISSIYLWITSYVELN